MRAGLTGKKWPVQKGRHKKAGIKRPAQKGWHKKAGTKMPTQNADTKKTGTKKTGTKMPTQKGRHNKAGTKRQPQRVAAVSLFRAEADHGQSQVKIVNFTIVTDKMSTAGRSFSCLASGASFLASITIQRLVSLECPRAAGARWKTTSAC